MSKKEVQTAAAADKKMRTKDLIYAGSFGAVYLVLMLIIVMGSGMIPILYVLSPFTVGVVCATVYMLCVLKVRKFGAALILGVLFALVACTSYWLSLVCGIIAALGAELVLYLGRYKSRKMYLLSFIVFNLNMACPFLMLLVARDQFISIAASFSGEQYASALSAVTPPWIYWAILALAIAGGIVGSMVANKLISKHFKKAGIIG